MVVHYREPTSTKNGLLVGYDFTLKVAGNDVNKLIKLLDDRCKKWVFQIEIGTSGYIHYQGRIRFKNKKRISTLKNEVSRKKWMDGIHFSITNLKTYDECNFDYVMDEGKRRNPDEFWSDKKLKGLDDVYGLIPLFIKEIVSLYPWQKTIWDSFAERDLRYINIVVCPVGNKGKSILTTYCRVYKKAFTIPVIKDYLSIIRMAYCVPDYGGFILDIPRALNSGIGGNIYAGIETIKDGWAFDDRNKFKWKEMKDRPIIWVFSNITPDLTYLSADRWKFWRLIGNKETGYLKEVDPDEESIRQDSFREGERF